MQFQRSLLEGLPIAAQSYSYTQPSGLSALLGTAGDASSLLRDLFGFGGGGSGGNAADAAKDAVEKAVGGG